MCFHNSMSAKAIKLAARYGRKSDIVEIYQDMLNYGAQNETYIED